MPTENLTVKNEELIIDLTCPELPVPNPERPRKRVRVIMDAVLVPTLAEVQRKKGANDDDVKKLQKLFKVCLFFERCINVLKIFFLQAKDEEVRYESRQ
jgi:hypothetical protein